MGRSGGGRKRARIPKGGSPQAGGRSRPHRGRIWGRRSVPLTHTHQMLRSPADPIEVRWVAGLKLGSAASGDHFRPCESPVTSWATPFPTPCWGSPAERAPGVCNPHPQKPARSPRATGFSVPRLDAVPDIRVAAALQAVGVRRTGSCRFFARPRVPSRARSRGVRMRAPASSRAARCVVGAALAADHGGARGGPPLRISRGPDGGIH